jgi:glutamyl/glutaminyl-tRNA synthetase
MQRLALYRGWGERLIRSGHAYRCYCTRAELDAQRDALELLGRDGSLARLLRAAQRAESAD